MVRSSSACHWKMGTGSASRPDASSESPQERGARYERRYRRERQARETAEHLLETKSLELYWANQRLIEARDQLEATVAERTHELIEARDAAEQASQAKSSFLATMSHELRTPMNGVLSVAALLAESPLDQEQQEFVEIISDSGRRLLELINDILDLSKVEAGELQLSPDHFELESFIARLCSPLALQAESKGIQLSWSIAPEVPGFLVADDLRLRQVLVNLLGNAIKFTDSGHVELVIQRAASDGPGPDTSIRFAIEDTGPGVAPDRRSAIFDTFTQADSSVTRRHGGTGLGLAISRRIVELMGGRLELESEVGVGSTFHFEVPLAVGARSGLRLQRSTSEEPDLRGRRVLVAEDHPVNQRVLSLMLEKLGCEYRVAANGLEVLRMLREAPYDVILMDWQMPEMSGIEATEQIRAMQSEPFCSIPILAVTANAMQGDREECLRAGMNDFLSKPIDRQKLMQKLAHWTGPLAA